MSRSKHQTLKSVFGGLSKGGIAALAGSTDDDVLALTAKRRIKREVIEERRGKRFVRKSDPE